MSSNTSSDVPMPTSSAPPSPRPSPGSRHSPRIRGSRPTPDASSPAPKSDVDSAYNLSFSHSRLRKNSSALSLRDTVGLSGIVVDVSSTSRQEEAKPTPHPDPFNVDLQSIPVDNEVTDPEGGVRASGPFIDDGMSPGRGPRREYTGIHARPESLSAEAPPNEPASPREPFIIRARSAAAQYRPRAVRVLRHDRWEPSVTSADQQSSRNQDDMPITRPGPYVCSPRREMEQRTRSIWIGIVGYLVLLRLRYRGSLRRVWLLWRRGMVREGRGGGNGERGSEGEIRKKMRVRKGRRGERRGKNVLCLGAR